jgi:hypothetical protein
MTKKSQAEQAADVVEKSASAEAAGQESEPTKSKWAPRFGSFKDNLAGVHLVEDRKNKRMTIQFEEKPSDDVRAVMKGDPYHYRFDNEEQLWYKPISPHTPNTSRAEADELVLKVANMIRAEKGIEQHEGYGASR